MNTFFFSFFLLGYVNMKGVGQIGGGRESILSRTEESKIYNPIVLTQSRSNCLYHASRYFNAKKL